MPSRLALLAGAAAVGFLPLACSFSSSTAFATSVRQQQQQCNGRIAIPRYEHGNVMICFAAAGGDVLSSSHGGGDQFGPVIDSTEASVSAASSSSGDSTATIVMEDSYASSSSSSSSSDSSTTMVMGESSSHAATATVTAVETSSLDSSAGSNDSTSTAEHDNAYFIRKDLQNTTDKILESVPQILDEERGSALDQQLDDEPGLSRRDAIRRTATILFAGTLIGGGTVENQWQQLQNSSRKIADLNYTRIIKETAIEIVVDGPMNREFLNSQTFQKVQKVKLPGWVPSFLVPPPKVIHDVTNIELLSAAAIAGSIVEMGRTSLLYPLLTLKTRVQADVNVQIRKQGDGARIPLSVRQRLEVTQEMARKHFREGNLYAGLLPSLLISVPATGVYFGVRDVVLRKLIPYTDALGGSISVALLAALAADVISLVIRTPADLLAVRLQAATGEEFEWEESQNRPIMEAERQAYLQEKIGNWFFEGVERIPAVILTDLPFLLSRIALNRFLLNGGPVSLGRYEGIVLFSAILCGLLTTPFDVARTRILVDSDDDPTNGIDGGSGEGLLRTFQTIKNEGDGGYRNLFAGWLERVAYLGIGRAWIEPLQILGYLAIRDFILLEWF